MARLFATQFCFRLIISNILHFFFRSMAKHSLQIEETNEKQNETNGSIVMFESHIYMCLYKLRKKNVIDMVLPRNFILFDN